MLKIFSNVGRAVNTVLGRDKPPAVELGGTGTVIFSGILTDTEYAKDLQGNKGLVIFEKMRKSDGQVKAALLACEMPYHSAYWDIEPASNSAQDKMIAEFIKENLFDGMTITWQDVLHHILLMLPFGFSVFEKVFELEGGLYRWRKLAPRLATTIYKWNVDEAGGLQGVEQRAFIGGKYKTVPIPVAKLLVFTNEREGSNFAGVSLLRAAYKHWYYKNTLYAIDGIAAERHGVGLATFMYPTAASPESKEKIKEVGQRLHAHERAYVALPKEIDFELKGVSGQLHDILGSIEHHDLQIARSILAQFINLGGGKEGGSYALSHDQSGFFLMALQAIGKNICNTINRYGIRQLVDYNWDVKGKYPKLTVSDLENFDVSKMADALTKLAQGDFIQPDPAIETELRRRMRLPVKIVGTERKPPEEEEEQGGGAGGGKQFKLWEPRRLLRGAELYVAFADIKDKLDSVEDKFVKAVSALQKRQIGIIVNSVSRLVENNDIERISTIDVPLRKEVAGEFEDILVELFEYGEEQVRQEYGKQRKAVKAADIHLAEPPDKRAFLKARALAMANILANKMRAAMAWEALHQIKEGVVDKKLLTSSLTDLSDRELRTTARFSASEALNLGRTEQAKGLKEEVDHITSSALLDDNTCPYCAGQDGKEWTADEAEGEEPPPYGDCEGEDRCRCVWIYTFKTEAKSR